MSSREQFLRTVTNALGRGQMPSGPKPLVYRHRVHTDILKDCGADELARVFVENSKTVGADVIETARDTLRDSVRRAVAQCGRGPVLLENEPLLAELGRELELQLKRPVAIWNCGEKSFKENIAFAEKAAVGIAVAKLALAESATVLFFSHEGCGRSVTLLPEANIHVIPRSVIRPRLTQGMQFLREATNRLPSSVNFISGPSATSDIELVRVVGVHGPVKVIHVVVADM